MISYIIIGKNESKNLKDLYDSICEFSSINDIYKFEIIYVDSNSSDNSIEIAKNIKFDKIFKITGYNNSAIARNIGAKNSTYNILFFIDGDLLLNNIKINKIIFNKIDDSIITFKLKEVIVDNNNVIKSYIRKYPKDLYGGMFLIRKKLFIKNNGMDEIMDKGQDYDFFIRSKKLGIKLIIINKELFIHYTESYRSRNRIKETAKKHSKYRSYLFKKNIGNSSVFKLICIEYYPLITCLFIPIQPIYSIFSLFLMVLYKIRRHFSIRSFIYEVIRQFNFIYYLLKYMFNRVETNIKYKVLKIR